MENYRGKGDLNDIVRASGGGPLSCVISQGSDTVPTSSWQQFPSDPLNFSSSAMEGYGLNAFGDPFSSISDPLLHELDVAAGSTYFSSPSSADHRRIINNSSTTVDDATNFPDSTTTVGQSKLFEEDMRSPCNIFSRIQIFPVSSSNLPLSPCDSPIMTATGVSLRGIKAPAVLPSDMINAKTTSKHRLIDNIGPVQISSPRNLGIKRRFGKTQVKKVVCIPAPAAANSRSSGEVVPSDLWAWRKYGQKPIKGSPYPRGYYRCSSSKGCSARKQVERSRNDPNMLVITYTSEHNHPWPTQRNALAGSTRSQPSKTNNASSAPKIINPKDEELKESSNDSLSPTNVAAVVSSTASASAKEESEDMEKKLEMEDGEFAQGIPQNYTPALMADSQQAEDFFAELDEIETDPLNQLFPHGFSQDEQKEKKTTDPFGLFGCPGNNGASF
ncbi:putative WRKY transcription factor 65 [Hibiscus syriacus]|uniref:WRKY transcription factor 65 n=1 Tax=Hibiscus syriacus TaxID=106335 RepID=A0A6A2WH77_HIBSY|nr:probable WRKY transcription factor 14 [Hibiscus syriacus]KAE8655315.1 putative WRKY transcription factor 65 [Hibiscus syriacus]